MSTLFNALVSKDAPTLRRALELINVLRDADRTMTHDKDAIIERLTAYDYQHATLLEGFGQLAFIQIDANHVLKVKYHEGEPYAIYIRYLEDESYRRLKIDIAYHGYAYYGFQKQKHFSPTVQETIEDVLIHLLNHPFSLTPAGRTDKGVHAQKQVIHLDTYSPLSDKQILDKMNTMLPSDIVALHINSVPRVFHARYDAVTKTYEYRIAKARNPFMAHTAYYAGDLNSDILREVLKQIEGTHDFKGLAKDTKGTKTIRTIESVSVYETDTWIQIYIQSAGFLRHMVRIIVGNAIRDTKKGTTTLRDALENPVANQPKYMAPAQGLYLYAITY